jgi:hypothetical protein
MYYDVRHLVCKRNMLPKERQEVEASIRFLYPWFSDTGFRAFLFLTDCTGQLGRALGWTLRVIGLDKVRQQIFDKLTGDYCG